MNATRRHSTPGSSRLRAIGLITLLLAVPLTTRAWHRLPPGREALAQRFGGIRGVTIGPIESSQQPGRLYGTPATAETLDELARIGANWVSLTPFGRIWSVESTSIDPVFEAPYTENVQGIIKTVEMAHARGMRVLLIPHLWVETGGWRGAIDPGSEAAWDDYVGNYTAFVEGWAKVAERAHADAFSIGVECNSWSGRRGADWERLIAKVRAGFSGLLTYSANWDEAEHVLFWDQLDFIGINAFYPLAHDNDSDLAHYVKSTLGLDEFYPLGHKGEAPSKTYVRNAALIAKQIESWTSVLDMPVVFAEIGYTTREQAAIEPWRWPDGMVAVKVDEAEQVRGLQALFDAFLPHRWFSGFFLWRYYNYLHDVSQEAIWGFSPRGKVAEQTLQAAFAERWGSDEACRATLCGARPR